MNLNSNDALHKMGRFFETGRATTLLKVDGILYGQIAS